MYFDSWFGNAMDIAQLLGRFAQIPKEERKNLGDTEVAISRDCAIFKGVREVRLPEECYVRTIQDPNQPDWIWDVYDLAYFTDGEIAYGSSSDKETLEVFPWGSDEDGMMEYAVFWTAKEPGGYARALNELLRYRPLHELWQ